jgi:hypothetical protein
VKISINTIKAHQVVSKLSAEILIDQEKAIENVYSVFDLIRLKEYYAKK